MMRADRVRISKFAFATIAILCLCALRGSSEVRDTGEHGSVLQAKTYRHYFDGFAEDEQAMLGRAAPLPWAWFEQNIPWLDVPDKQLEQIYYFRWYSFQKHIRETPYGHVIDEFLDDVPWAGKYNTINDAAGHHIREARWLRDGSYADQYARFWLSPAGEPRRYSLALADAVYSLYLTSGDTQLAVGLLPSLVGNYEAWEKTHQDANGLFWQIDDRDGMEDSIGGSGYRPTINSYMYGDAMAIMEIARLAGDKSLQERYAAKANTLRQQVETRLWNPNDQFYETLPRGEGATWSGVREEIGYVPWYFKLPAPGRDVAWHQLTEPRGFAGAFGPTTAERRAPRYRFSDPHECLWNGPSWPFATTQTLVALANLLNGPAQPVISKRQWFDVLEQYVRSQHIRTAWGTVIPWIDEDLDPDTGEWIARSTLERKKQPPPNRGRYYNHSGFADLIITGLVGLRPSAGNTLEIHPLLPEGEWAYFALDGLPYHGHRLTILYDVTGGRYYRGKGLRIFVDGTLAGTAPKLSPLTVRLGS